MLTYDEAVEKIAKSRDGRKKLENNTYLYKVGDDYAVKLHATDVVTICSNGAYILNTGGWRTPTTKDRINRYAPGVAYSDKGEWYWKPARRSWDEGIAYPFADGMRVYADGRVEGAGVDAAPLRRAVLRKVKKYVDGFAESVHKHGLDHPSSGDCWGCSMRAENEDKLPPGHGIMGVDHIFSHFEELYYVPSLLWRAVQNCGNPEFCYRLSVDRAMAGDFEMIKRFLRSYFRKLMPALVEHELNSLQERAA